MSKPRTATPLLATVRKAIESLNSCYGKGQVTSVRLFFNGVGWFEYTISTSHHGRSKPMRRRFHIYDKDDRLTVFAFGRQKTVKIKQQD